MKIKLEKIKGIASIYEDKIKLTLKVIVYSGVIIAICIKYYNSIYLSVLIGNILVGLIIGLPIMFIIGFLIFSLMSFLISKFRIIILEKMYPKISEKLKREVGEHRYNEFLIKAIILYKNGFDFKIEYVQEEIREVTNAWVVRGRTTGDGPHDWGVEYPEETETETYTTGGSYYRVIQGEKIK